MHIPSQSGGIISSAGGSGTMALHGAVGGDPLKN